MARDFSDIARVLPRPPRTEPPQATIDPMPLTGPPIDLRPGSRPPPEPKYEPSDHDTTLAVLEGRQAPKVCPYCGRPWRSDARCACQEPEPYTPPWTRLWRWLVALVTPPPPRVVYADELPRPQPIPRPPRRQTHRAELAPRSPFDRERSDGASQGDDLTPDR